MKIKLVPSKQISASISNVVMAETESTVCIVHNQDSY